jgi:hypothetical protein
MFKLFLILLLGYLLFRAGRNLLLAAVKDGMVPGDDRRRTVDPGANRSTDRATVPHVDIEDAVWEDLP